MLRIIHTPGTRIIESDIDGLSRGKNLWGGDDDGIKLIAVCVNG